MLFGFDPPGSFYAGLIFGAGFIGLLALGYWLLGRLYRGKHDPRV